MFNKIIIIGLGLIGGSIAKDIRAKKLAAQILAFDQDSATLNFALNHKIIDKTYDFNDKISDHDLIIIAVPVTAYLDVVRFLLPVLSPNTLLIDVGSVKSFIRSEILPILGDFAKNFIPCHPIAGLEKSGVESAINNLFLGKKIIITPNKLSANSVTNQIIDFWQKVGSETEFLEDHVHDKIFALTSHLPQLISFHLKSLDLRLLPRNELVTKHLRLEKSSEEMWQGIFHSNRSFINNYLNEFDQNIKVISTLISSNEWQKLDKLLAQSQQNFAVKKLADFNLDEETKKILFCRVLVVLALVLIDDIKYFHDYFGSGFQDFTLILSYLEYLSSSLDFVAQNQQYFLNKLRKINDKFGRYSPLSQN